MKKIISFAMAFALMLTVTACSGEAGNDSKFVKDMEKGLEARWDYIDSSTEEDEKTSLDNAVQKELDQIAKYKDLEFENPELGKLAKDYIESLEDQKDALKYYNNDDLAYIEKWDSAYDRRTEIIITMVDKFGLEIDEEELKEFKDNAQVIKEENNVSEKIDEQLHKSGFKEVSNDYGWKKYEAVLENNTGNDLENFYMDISLKDSDDIIIETTSAYVNGTWKNGDKVKVFFETDKSFEKVEWESNYTIK